MTQNRELYPVGSDLFVDVYDLTVNTPEGFEAGFYYNIPLDNEGNHDRDADVRIEGPFASREAALQAGVDFISEALVEPEAVAA